MQDVFEHGAFVYVVDFSIPHLYKQYTTLKRENLYIVEEIVSSL